MYPSPSFLIPGPLILLGRFSDLFFERRAKVMIPNSDNNIGARPGQVKDASPRRLTSRECSHYYNWTQEVPK